MIKRRRGKEKTNSLGNKKNQERTLLVGIRHPRESLLESKESLFELERLVRTAGGLVVAVTYQEVKKIHPATYIGQGKLEEISQLVTEYEIQTVIFDEELSAGQNRNLEEKLKCKVIDRTGLILDIFAQRAKTKEGKLQVELAQCMYIMPRLVGQWGHFSRLGGGIGTRGPGETQLEVDRRRLRERIHRLKEKLAHVEEYRDLQRHKREQVPVPTIAMVGYTNAGKSTLMNSLTEAGVMVEDKLFATLDPTVRRLRLPSGRQVLLSDTVGFIRKLPHQLVKAFQATFEEVRAADVLLHIVDMSSPTWQQQKEVVEKVLAELGLDSKPRLEVLNKVDLLGNGASNGGGIKISARDGTGVKHLLDQIEAKLREGRAKVYLKIPYHLSGCLDWLHQVAEIHWRNFKKDGIYLQVSLTPENANRLKNKHQIKIGAKHCFAPTDG